MYFVIHLFYQMFIWSYVLLVVLTVFLFLPIVLFSLSFPEFFSSYDWYLCNPMLCTMSGQSAIDIRDTNFLKISYDRIRCFANFRDYNMG